ncbi:AfsA-related hotdog domain-containing protein [Streptomyces sp.]|uniref:AfsA-related hotdog domain-containing protein n=1 Tax=Streptomyces sp. TaxID=1931 RepID=UPI002F3EEA8F
MIVSTLPSAPPLTGFLPATARTVDRALVHRSSLSEVFLTDLRPEDDGFLATAQLPRSHAYWGDHVLSPASYDPVLLIEVCRQATLAGSHRFYGVPMDSKFILTQQTLALTRPELLTIGTEPAVLLLRATVTERREKEGVVTGLDYALRLYALPVGQDAEDDGATELGTAEVGLRFRSPDSYADLRLRGRGGRAPRSTAQMPAAQQAFPAAPHLVGRQLADNVVLSEPRPEKEGASATLRIAASHPSLFDHAQDHVPGMVLIEGARQLSLHTLRDQLGLAPERLRVLGIRAAYQRFGELETPISLGTELPSAQDALLADQFEVLVKVYQDDQIITDLTVSVGRVAR